MKLIISSHLADYTQGQTDLQVSGSTPRAAFQDLDQKYPGMTFRFMDETGHLRQHFNLFIDGQRTRDLDTPLPPSAVIHLLAALSGG